MPAGKQGTDLRMQLHTNEISFEHHGAVTLLDIQGDITSFSEPFLTEAYQNANDQGASNILLKIDTDAYINSGGIAVLIQILSQTKQNNQKIGIAGVSNHYKKILSMVGITKFAKIHDTVESAIQMMA
jgi:anti-anti-sigma factor